MNTHRNSLRDLLIALETNLHSAEIRYSKVELNKLLSDDFIEYGASGQIFSKEDILNRLPEEPATNIQASEFKFHQLSENIAQVTYKSCSQVHDKEPRYTLRSSIWRNNNSQWKMIFHQGTVTEKLV